MGTCPVKCKSNAEALERTQDTDMSEAHRTMIVSLCDYPPSEHGELTMRKGERLTIISDDGDFLMVKSTTTGRESYIPSNYTAKVTNRWLFTGISRYMASELLLSSSNQTGAFLIRQSESIRDNYALSVLRRDGPVDPGSVAHYRINHIENGWFYVSPNLTFPSLVHLVEHYSEFADGLSGLLREPCFIEGAPNATETTRPVPTVIRKPTLNWKDVSRSMIFRKNRADSENSLVSEGLREAIHSYLYMTEASEEDSVQN